MSDDPVAAAPVESPAPPDPVTPAPPAPLFPKASVVPSSVPRVVSKLWWLTGLSLLVAVVLVIGSQRRVGPRITIRFADGHGLKAGDELRYRGIVVGEVTDVTLQPKLGGIAVTVALESQAASLARAGTEFWIERPRVSLSRVSGLETVVGAKYLGVRPGPGSGPLITEFTGIESPPTLAEAEFREITIQFADGHGLQIGDPVRHRGIVIGEVTAVELRTGLAGDDSATNPDTPESLPVESQQMASVRVTVRLVGGGRQVAREGSLFWVERPRVTLAEVRGLETLVGGQYIAVTPGPDDAAPSDSFVGLERAPVTAIPPNGIEIILHAPQRWGIDRGVPVTYRGLKVGQVHSVGLSSDGTRIEARAIIEARYRALVRRNSVFWSTSGIDVNVGITGLQFTADTLSTIAQGGIAFATPDPPGDLARSGQRFQFEKTAQDEWVAWRPHVHLGSPLPGHNQHPEPLRAVVRWTERSFGFSRQQQRTGWAMLLDNQQLVGPADLFVPSEHPIGDVTLEVGGMSIKVEASQVKVSGLTASLALPGSLPEGIPVWQTTRIRSLSEPEDVLILADPQTPAIPMAAVHLTARDGTLELDTTSGLTPNWHGSPVIATKDGRLVGLLLFRRGTPVISCFEAGFLSRD